ncbi:MAG: phage portal protein [Desulfobacterales bacterium]|nr:phage portal protein [Desulfobacterales bacterium]
MAIFEVRSADINNEKLWTPSFFNFAQSGSGAVVNKDSSMRVASVFSCVKAISDDKASLPIEVRQKLKGGGSIKLKDHYAYERVKLRPNPEMGAFVFKKTLMPHALLDGNSYSFIERTMMNPCKYIWPLSPEVTTLERVRKGKGRGVLRYKVQDGYSYKYYSADNILHTKNYSNDGVLGISVITNYAQEQIGIGIEMDRFQANFFKNGMNPGGIFSHPKTLGEKQKPDFIAGLKARYGSNKKSRAPMILENGMEFKPYEIKMADQQMLDLLKLNKVDICGIFGVPQSRISISDSNTNFNNTEQEKRRYYQSGLLPWIKQDEEEMNYKILSEKERKAGIYIMYNFNAFLRGDSKERSEISEKWWRMGVPLNDLLEFEDRNPVEGGDVGRVQLNTAAITDIDKIQEPETKSTDKRNRNEMVLRDRIQRVYLPSFQNLTQDILNYESKSIKEEIKNPKFNKSLDRFYRKFKSYIDQKSYPLFRAFSQEIYSSLSEEIGVDSEMSPKISKDINKYVERFVNDYRSSSIGQLKQSFKEGGKDSVLLRLDEWNYGKEGKSRPLKLAERHIVSLDNRVARSVIHEAGFRAIWKNRVDTCEKCKELNGKSVGINGEFIIEGERSIKHPQLHEDCRCFITWI